MKKRKPFKPIVPTAEHGRSVSLAAKSSPSSPARSRPRTSPPAAPRKPRALAEVPAKRAKPTARNAHPAIEPRTSIARALLSVYDKDGIVEFARDLAALGVEILSTGGTARFLLDSGIPVSRIASYTGFPEMLDGRVKTLHPKIHAGIMAVRGNVKHMDDLRKSGIKPIDLVVVNLYPFEKTAAMAGIGFDEVLEMIDVGGPTMLRAAAKNFRHVGVVVDPLDYRLTLAELRENGTISETHRFDLARKAFRHVAAYDTAIYSYLARLRPDGTLSSDPGASPYPETLSLDYSKIQDLRYGENPHQSAAFFREITATGPSIASALKLQGKELSFNNIVDLDAALSLVAEFDTTACAVIKHTNPCGVGLGRAPAEALGKALDTDPDSAYGGVIGFNVRVDRETARALAGHFVEAIVAPSFTSEAREILSTRKGLRLLEVGSLSELRPSGFDLKRVKGGLLAQEWDSRDVSPDDLRVVTRRSPTPEEMQALVFAWKVAKHVRSNAIVYALADRTLGVGAGQMSRLDSARIGAKKARTSLAGSVIASDAFFPFRDGLDEAAACGVTAVIQPGGSIRDEETIAAANERDLAMVFTGIRHFRH